MNLIKKTALSSLLGLVVLAATALPAQAETNPFESQSIMTVVSQTDDAQGSHDDKGKMKSKGKCGEGKCGEGKKKAKGKCGEGKCGEGKKKAESKCGEGKCGESKKKGKGKCGEGKMKSKGKCGEGK
ncbi:MAG: hypothetical protein HRT38_19530 [Alteromonadaceae bacterium]|nr:hypothetical protein [Alteromonadaceae bacterium]